MHAWPTGRLAHRSLDPPGRGRGLVGGQEGGVVGGVEGGGDGGDGGDRVAVAAPPRVRRRRGQDRWGRQGAGRFPRQNGCIP
eukprot:1946501-Prymnesium_polylepis.1